MAIRRWGVRPDQLFTLRDGRELEIVSREATLQAFVEAETVMASVGGMLRVAVDRVETDLPGERVTTGMVFEWRDRPDARPNPEVAVPVALAGPEPLTDEEIAAHFPEEEAVAESVLPFEHQGERALPNEEPDEDESSIPEHLRGAV